MNGSSLTRRSGIAVAVMFAFALATASVAWGCASIQPKLTAESQGSGPAGSHVTITGKDFGPGPVEVRWNSRTGQLLGKAVSANGSFSVTIKIPEKAAVGVHLIFATSTTAEQRMSFEVTKSPTASSAGSAPASAGSTTSGSEEDSSTSNSTQQRTDTGNSNATSGDNTDRQSNAGSNATESVAGSTGSEAAPAATIEGATAARGSATGSGAAATPVTQRQTTTASSNPAAVTTPAGQPVFGGSVATVSTDTPSAATVSGDTWSGFGTTTKPSLLSDGGVATSSSAPGSAPAVGLGLLGAGVVALLAGFGAAESARKRALAGTVAR